MTDQLTEIDRTLRGVLRPGQVIAIGQALGAPRQLIAALPRHLDALQGSRLLVGMVQPDFPDLPGVVVDTFFPTGPFSTVSGMAERNGRYLRLTLHELSRKLASGEIRVDVALAQASVPVDGVYSLGITVDFIHAAIGAADAVVLEVNPATPHTGAESTVSGGKIRPIPVAQTCLAAPSQVVRPDNEMARNLLRWIPDGATLEFGIGQWFPPLIGSLAAERRGLKIHTGQLGPWVFELLKAGALDAGSAIRGTGAAGPADFYRCLEGHPQAVLQPALRTHAPAVLHALPQFRAINSVFEIDLLGQANSEVRANGSVGGIGGLPDFARGAVGNPEGLSIVVLKSEGNGVSRITRRISSNTPSVAADEIDVVVTEHGSADLRGLSAGDRAEALTEIAAPAHRAWLRSGD